MIAHVFFKGEQAYTRLFGIWPSGQGGGDMLYIGPNTKNNFFKIDLLTVIQLNNTACICFLKGKQPYTRFFDNKGFQIRGDTKSDFSLTES